MKYFSENILIDFDIQAFLVFFPKGTVNALSTLFSNLRHTSINQIFMLLKICVKQGHE